MLCNLHELVIPVLLCRSAGVRDGLRHEFFSKYAGVQKISNFNQHIVYFLTADLFHGGSGTLAEKCKCGFALDLA